MQNEKPYAPDAFSVPLSEIALINKFSSQEEAVIFWDVLRRNEEESFPGTCPYEDDEASMKVT